MSASLIDKFSHDRFNRCLGPVYTYCLCLHVRHHLCQIYIMYIVTVRLTVRMGSVPILSTKRSVSIDTMVNFDGDGDGHGDGDGKCKQALTDWNCTFKNAFSRVSPLTCFQGPIFPSFVTTDCELFIRRSFVVCWIQETPGRSVQHNNM